MQNRCVRQASLVVFALLLCIFNPVQAQTFSSTASMASARNYHTATLLANGKVLIAGGYDGTNYLSTAEVYDPAGSGGAGSFTSTGSMSTARVYHTATLLPNGTVLISGGFDGTNNLSTAELYDPAGNGGAGSFTLIGSLGVARSNHTATLLNNGKVLIAGGAADSSASAEIYDPAGNGGSGAFTFTGSMSSPRSYHTATLLPGGKVLIAGGYSGGYLASAEIFDPAGNGGAGAFSPTGSMSAARSEHLATLLPNGKVLITGGYDYGTLATAELYDPAGNGGAGAFTSTGSMSTARRDHTATLLNSSKVLIAGGSSDSAVLSSAEIYDPAGNSGAGAFTSTGSMSTARALHTASLLSNGKVLIAGGSPGGSTALATAELYTDFVPVASFQVTAPANVAAGAPFNITVTALDASNNPVTSYTGTIHFTSSDTHPHRVLPADSTLTNGTGTFSVTLETPGPQTITATDTADATTTGVSAQIQVGSELPVISSFAPTSGSVGTSVVLTGADFLGTTSVTFAGAGGGTVNAQFTVDTDYQITAVVPAGARTGIISVTNPAGTDTTTSISQGPTSFTVTAGTSAQLVITQGPTTTTAGQPITPALTVEVRDANGILETGDNTDTVTLAITGGTGTTGAVLNGMATQTVVNGVATFSNLSINTAGTGYTLTATTAGLSSAVSNAFDIIAGAAGQLAFTQQPTTVTAGQSIAPAITVEVRDAYGNVLTGDNTDSVMLAITGGTGTPGATLNGTVTGTAANGVVNFSDLSINQAGTGYTLTAGATGLTGATSSPFNITAAAPTQLVFVQGPATTVSGATITPPVTIQVEDTYGNLVSTDNTDNVTLAITNGTGTSGATLSGTVARPTVNGVATFNDLSIDKTGAGYTLTATAAGLTGAVSGQFNITVGAASQLVFTQQPSTTSAGQPITPAITIEIRDPNGNLLTGDNTDTVTLAITGGTGTSGAALNGTLTQMAANGIVTFSGLSINQAGAGYTLTATLNTSTVTAPSSAFDITPGAASQLVIVQGPTTTIAGAAITPPVTVQVEDTYGNLVSGDNTDNVTLSITNGTGAIGASLSGTVTQMVINGVATFNNLSINKAGTGYTLTASAAGLASAISGQFNITAGAASQLVFTQQPNTTSAGQPITPAITVEIRDANGNLLTGDNTDTVTLSITSGTGTSGATLSGTVTRKAVNGVVTFSGLSITRAGVGYTLTATINSGSFTAPSSAFDITPGAARQLAIIQQPTSTPAGSTITPAVTVQIQDAYGNLVTTDNSDTVTVAITAGTGTPGATLGRTVTQTVVNGVATFNNLSINKAGPGYSLTVGATLNGSPVTAITTIFAITGPPTLTTISPTNTPVQSTPGPGITLIVNGTNFENTYSVVKWKGSARPTTYVSPTQLRAAIPASDLRTAGSASITVTNNPNGATDPNAGTSNSVIFQVGSPNLVLTLPTPITRNAATGVYTANVRISNTGTLDASSVQVTGASTISGTPYVNTATGTALPTTSSTIAVGNHQDFTFTFPASAGARGAAVTVWIRGTYNSGIAFSITAKGTLP